MGFSKINNRICVYHLTTKIINLPQVSFGEVPVKEYENE